MTDRSQEAPLYRWFAALMSVAVLAPVSVEARDPGPPRERSTTQGAGDAVVVAVLDFGLNPYHWDFLSSKMPQHSDSDPANDLPLDRPANEWLPGFPAPSKEFASFDKLDLTLEAENAQMPFEGLKQKDQAKWTGVKKSLTDEMHAYWMPGTKVIGAMTFSSSEKIIGTASSHGVGTTSSAVGNIHGTCPECLLFFIELGSVAESEAAIEWAMSQPWIDAISNSYGFSAAYRDRIYSGSDVDAQREASERGQTVFFSAGNGNDGAFVVPNTTSFSSQEGPDWIVTVGAVSPGPDNHYGPPGPGSAAHASYSGHGKPSDVAGVGSKYPTAYNAAMVGETGSSGFGGTSNATPQIVGTYSRLLHEVRRALPGPSRIQRNGVIAKGRFRCAGKNPKCELRDGVLTAEELRLRLFHSAVHTEAGYTVGGFGTLPSEREHEFLNEGHGSYFGLETGKRSEYMKEFRRIAGPLFGRAKSPERPEGEHEWMVVDSYCRQKMWGKWSDGYYKPDTTELPPPDPDWPLRTAYMEGC
ncbi:MAG: S8 family serine peptidase [Actinomycetota bacterium]